jgi:uncharacterized membrane protein YfcA
VNLLLLAGAGVLAGAVNSAVGSGTLLTYPVLVASGLPPVVANGTNTLGLIPGSAAAAWGYRRELRGRMRRLIPLCVAIMLGASVGAWAVVRLPDAFEAVVPWLILAAVVLVLVQPWLARRLETVAASPDEPHHRALVPSILGTGVYSGYFGAGQGMVLLAVLGTLHDHDLQRSNGVKNLLAACANVVSATVFVIAASVNLAAALAIGVGALIGGLVGAPVTRRLPQAGLRGLVVAVGLVAAVASFVRY